MLRNLPRVTTTFCAGRTGGKPRWQLWFSGEEADASTVKNLTRPREGRVVEANSATATPIYELGILFVGQIMRFQLAVPSRRITTSSLACAVYFEFGRQIIVV